MLFKPVFVPGSTSEVDFFLSEFVGTKHFSLEGSDFFPTSKERNNNWIELRLNYKTMFAFAHYFKFQVNALEILS